MDTGIAQEVLAKLRVGHKNHGSIPERYKRFLFFLFSEVLSYCSHECAPDEVNVSETCTTLPGRSEVSLAANNPC